jgi:hypothetical protein
MAACGHGAPPPQKPVERQVASVADLAGTWVASDEMDFGYTLTLSPDGGFDQFIDRNRMGKCEQKGTLRGQGAFKLAYTRDDCRDNPLNGPPPTVDVKIESFTGDALTLAIGTTRRAYRRQ